MHSIIVDMDTTCQDQLDALWTRYTNASGGVEDCNIGCLNTCKQTLLDALYAEQGVDCPPQTEIQRCFSLFSDAWEIYAGHCALFQFDAMNAGALLTAGEAEGSRRRLTQVSEAEGVAVTGSAASVSGGCFPPFTDIEEFEAYVSGNWDYETKSNAVGITLSVLFFCGLAAIGVLMKG